MSPNQLVFQEMFVGALIFVAVLGVLRDYTDIVYAKSFSIILLAAIVLEVLTFATLWLKKKVLQKVTAKYGPQRKLLKLLSIWPILFFSKFVFIWVLDLLFSDYMYVKGFVGILLVVGLVTIIQRLAYAVFAKLG